MIDYAEVLSRKFKGREWTLVDNDYDTLTMLDDGPKPTKKQLDDAWPDVVNEISAEIDQRKAAKVSARAKLKALGLTDDEIAALVS